VFKGLGINSRGDAVSVSSVNDVRDLSIGLAVPRIGKIEVSISFPSLVVGSETLLPMAGKRSNNPVTNFVSESSNHNVINSVPVKPAWGSP